MPWHIATTSAVQTTPGVVSINFGFLAAVFGGEVVRKGSNMDGTAATCS
jgi:hypothetical protein